jgi:hypothetical protein
MEGIDYQPGASGNKPPPAGVLFTSPHTRCVEEDVMVRYLKNHRWMAGIAAAFVVGAAVAAGCASSSKSTKPANGPITDAASIKAQSGGTTSSETAAQPPAGDLSANTASDAWSSGGPGAPSTLPSTLDRKIIQTGTFEIETDDVSKKFADVGTIAAGAGGFIANSSFGSPGAKQTASITIRVPGDRYQSVVIELRKLGDVTTEQLNTNDVTQDYTDLQSRLRNLQAAEGQYVLFLTKAETIGDVLAVQDRLTATRGDIEQVQGRINLMQNQTDLATITVHLNPPAAAVAAPKTSGPSSPMDVARDSFQASLDVLLAIATVGIAVAAFSWWMVPLALVGVAFARRQNRQSREHRAAPPAAPVG